MNTSYRLAPLRRSASPILGGVCGGIAERLGVRPVLVRLGAVVVGLVSSGLAVVVYVVAWVLIPPVGTNAAIPASRSEADPAERPFALRPPAPVAARERWYAVGDQLQALVGELRRPVRDVDDASARSCTPLASLDRAATDVGDRLRRPEVHAASRRVVDGLSAAVSSGITEAIRRRDG